MRNLATRQEIAFYVRTIRALIAVIVVLVIACGTLTFLLLKGENTPETVKNSSVASKLTEKEKVLMTLATDIDLWQLRLVGPQNPLPEKFSIEEEKIQPAFARDLGMTFDKNAVSYLNQMCTAAKKENINLLVISSFRTRQRQTTLYNNQVAKQKVNYPNKSQSEIEKIAATISAYPGTSEHEVGLAVDFNSVEESFEKTDAFNWLKANAAEYGFVLRYPKDKQSITGVIYEPWHYRYVGEKHAKKMNELGLCLEEYITLLKKYTK